MHQKDLTRKATPLVYLIKLEDIEKDEFDLKVDLRQYDLSIIQKHSKKTKFNVEIPDYLQNECMFPLEMPEEDHMTTVLHILMK